MRLLLAFILLLCINKVNSQNLVPNPSFEDTVSCPSFGGDIDKAVGWSSYRDTPDYFNSCASAGLGVPLNARGFQNPAAGNAYSGIVCYTTVTPNVREYIGRQLFQPLSIGQQYYVSFYVSLADNFTFDCAINKIGIKFSTTPYTISSPAPIDNSSFIYSDTIISDKLNWTKIKGTFIANQPYEYLIIGNFYSDNFIDTLGCIGNAFYYIDDVCVSTDSILCYSQTGINDVINSGNDILFPTNASDEISLKSSVKYESLEIFNLISQCCYFNSEFAPERKIDITQFSSGIHYLRINREYKSVIKIFNIIK